VNFNGTINLAAEDRPIDALLAAYAAKTLSAPLAALVAAHLELKPDSRGYVAALEVTHGIFLEELKPVPLAGRDRRLVNIFAATAADATPVVTCLSDDAEAVLPRALRRLAGCDHAGLPWRRRSAGLKEAVAAQGDGGEARFICLRPGTRLPALGGNSPAVALVIAGALTDRDGYHEHGDIVFADREAELVAAGDVDCICFVASEDAAKPAGTLSRILRRVIGG
jgi:putative transcriptional regulator